MIRPRCHSYSSGCLDSNADLWLPRPHSSWEQGGRQRSAECKVWGPGLVRGEGRAGATGAIDLWVRQWVC